MQVIIYKDGSFEFSFPKEEAGLGAALVAVIRPYDQESEAYLKQAARILAFLEKHGYLPDHTGGNVVPLKKPPH